MEDSLCALGGEMLGVRSGTSPIADAQRALQALRESEERDRVIVNNAPLAIICFQDFKAVFGNERAAALLHCDAVEEFIGDDMREYVDPDGVELIERRFKSAYDGGFNPPAEFKISLKDGTSIWIESSSAVISLQGKKTLLAMMLDISSRKEAEETILRQQEILSEQHMQLEQKSHALDEILSKIGSEEERVKAQIAANITNVIHPLISRLRAELPAGPRKLVDILESALGNISDRFGLCTKKSFRTLSRKEKEMCNLIRGGLTTKEIASVMRICPSTVETHRKNIRKKLGLQNSGANLSSFLYDVGGDEF